MDSYYPQGGDEMDAAAPDEAGGGEEGKAEETTEPTALIPKTLLGGKEFKPGEEVVLKIVHDHGDEIEVAYATDDAKKSDQPEMDKATDSMSAMAT